MNCLYVTYHLNNDPDTYGIQELASQIDLDASIGLLVGNIDDAIAAAYPNATIEAVRHNTAGWLPPTTAYIDGVPDPAAQRDIDDIIESTIAQYDRWLVYRDDATVMFGDYHMEESHGYGR